MRVLFTTTGHSGHLLPLAPLAHASRLAGHEVLVATYASRVENVDRLRLSWHAIPEAPEERWAPLMIGAAALGQREADALMIGEGFARIGGGAALPHLLELVEYWCPDVLVHECYEFAGPIAADHHGVPHARVALGLASTEEWVDELAASTVAELRDELLLPDGGDTTLLSLVPPSLDDGPAALRFRGPLPGVAKPLPGWWANADDPLVYVSFGSVSGSLPVFPALYRGVLDALGDAPVRVLLTLGRDADPSLLGPLPANAHAEQWLPQNQVLPHAAAVVGHGGYGTTLGALDHGVPTVLLPLFAGDQWRTARRVAELGAGLVLDDAPRRVFDPPSAQALDALPGAVARVIGDERFRRAAAELGREMADLPVATAAVPLLEQLAGAAALSR
jgi:UDP:flavonoid glycosyltransferase YjiC (YdhE family)